MNKFDQFLSKHGSKIIIILLVLTYFKSCSISSEVERVKKDLRATEVLFQDLDKTIQALPTRNDLRIEGLRSEKRMIQATDRKMLDVQRQNAIEKEIEELSK
jgi:hypothetical protein